MGSKARRPQHCHAATSSAVPAEHVGEESDQSGPGFQDRSHNEKKEDLDSRSVESVRAEEDKDKDSDESLDTDFDSGSEAGRARITRSISEVRDGIQIRRDVELGADNDQLEKQATQRSEHDPNLVTWDGPNDPENPKCWTYRKKWLAVFVVSIFTLISPVSSSMTAPALPDIGRELHITLYIEQILSLSIFLLAYAIGPLCMGPLSEIYGRTIVLQLSNLLFLFFNLGCGLARTKEQLIAFRFFAGLGGSAPLAIGGGVLSDLFTAEERGRAISIYSLMPLLGPAIGPIAGGFITQQTSWRWIFHAVTIADGLVQVLGFFFLRETYAPVLLGRRRARLVRETGNADLHTIYDRPDRTLAQTLRIALTRPFRLLFTQVILQVLALYMMYLYGIMYIQLSTFPALWRSYGMGVGAGGLHYISLGVGFFLGAQVCAPLQDRVYAALKRRRGLSAEGLPEFRVPMMVPGAVLVPAGLLVYGWTAQCRTHWIGPDVGAAMLTAGVIVGFQCIQGYLVDTYALYAASAIGAATVLRSLAGFGFPLFAPALYDRLDYGWGNSVMALVAVVVGWPAPILLWKYGAVLRARSPYAQG
ncbi:uncharacterized protein E0L32_008558 [Thyridium curvatum]|uniref:Major facilitator superfamily (MFS) profile domain-containing protein n=1 Tax=Thyridium curvatum TaxID=1093900 RepID=A0A507B0L1_9PEZI|nr:uncharacterized protein E0L32_008558 [Thyridium curvatum]TPX10508.1 hypothetical protein E0L32_008558 [Thyridium curvatum]